MRNINEIMTVINIAGKFTMITGLHRIDVSLAEDGESLAIYPYVDDHNWNGWRNYTSPEIRITSYGEVFSIHDDEEDWWDRLKENSHPSNFVAVNHNDWRRNYFDDEARTIKEYVLNLAEMWATYKMVNHNA